MSDVGTFRTAMKIESMERRGDVRLAGDALVDTGSKFTWVPRELLESLGVRQEFLQSFRVADGREIQRPVGMAIVHAGGRITPDWVVFAEPNDTVILGAHSLEGMNVRVDAQRKLFVDAGPVLAGVAA